MRIGISALSGVAALLLGWILPMMYPSLPDWLQYAFFGVAVLALVGAGVMALFDRDTGSGGGNLAKTAGDRSPAFAGNFGDIHLYGKVEAPEKIEAKPREAPPLTLSSRADPIPDFKLDELMRRLVQSHPEQTVPSSARLKEITDEMNRDIVDKVKFHKLHMWGRRGNSPLRRISDYDLSHGELSVMRKKFLVPGSWDVIEYTDIRFLREEMDEHFPAPEENSDGQEPAGEV